MGDVFKSSGSLPPCERCDGPVLISSESPVEGTFGQPVKLQLCPACDAGKPAAGRLIRWLESGAGRVTDEAAVKASAREAGVLFAAWQKEVMAEHGYRWVPNTEPPSGPAPYRGPRPRGRG
jgi:hypothetical protein